MKNIIIPFISAVSALVLSSCFQHEVTITLNKDGSGTVVEESRMGAQMLAMIGQMAAGFGEAAGEAQDPLADMLSEEKAKERAKELGEGVTLAQIEPVEVSGSKGARVTYKFKDINKLNMDIGSGMNSMPSGPDDEDGENEKKNPIGFSYEDGILSIKMPEPEKKEASEEDEMPDDPQTMAMMKQMFGDMKMSIMLAIAPGIAETNATHRDGDTITLMEMDFGKLVENPEALKKLAATQNEEDPAAMMKALEGIDGVKVEVQPEITVNLK